MSGFVYADKVVCHTGMCVVLSPVCYMFQDFFPVDGADYTWILVFTIGLKAWAFIIIDTFLPGCFLEDLFYRFMFIVELSFLSESNWYNVFTLSALASLFQTLLFCYTILYQIL